MSTIRLCLDIPPSANRYWRNYRGRVVKSAEATAYKALVALTCNLAGIEPLSGDVAVTFTVYRQRRAGDLDNFQKVLFDALNGYAYRDDKQIAEIHAYRRDDRKNPRIEIEVTAL